MFKKIVHIKFDIWEGKDKRQNGRETEVAEIFEEEHGEENAEEDELESEVGGEDKGESRDQTQSRKRKRSGT